MKSITYRAAIWTSDDGQYQIALTCPDESRFPADALMERAREEAANNEVTGGRITIGEWSEDCVTDAHASRMVSAGFSRMN